MGQITTQPIQSRAGRLQTTGISCFYQIITRYSGGTLHSASVPPTSQTGRQSVTRIQYVFNAIIGWEREGPLVFVACCLG